MKRVLVLGFGVSGKAAAALLKSRGVPTLVVDKKADSITVFSDEIDVSFEEISQVVLSPGIPHTHTLVQKAIAHGIEVIGEIELAFRFMQNRCVGITGANGKTTTTLLTTHVLNAAGFKAKAVGNVGVALSETLLSTTPDEILVIELSSFQLETLKQKKMEVAICLNVTPNHLDRYASMQEYAEAKMGIQDCLKEGGKFFLSDRVSREYKHLIRVPFELFDGMSLPVFLPTQLALQNTQAALTLCFHFGITSTQFFSYIESFRKPPHRIEWVGDRNGAHYYNDSKASNVDAVIHAISLLRSPIVLIIGGMHKGASYEPWIIPFRNKVKKIIAYGQAAPLMQQELAQSYPFAQVKTLTEAVKLATNEAAFGDNVLLSPGCSSYDQFRNYEHRGDEFKRLFKESL